MLIINRTPHFLLFTNRRIVKVRLVTVLVKILKNNKYKVFRNLHRMNQTFNSMSEGADQEGACSMWLTLSNKGLL